MHYSCLTFVRFGNHGFSIYYCDRIFSSKFLRTHYGWSAMGYLVIKLVIKKYNMMFAASYKFNTTNLLCRLQLM